MICAGNWKLNKTPEETKAFIAQLLTDAIKEEQENLVLLPPALCLSTALDLLVDSEVQAGGQNCHAVINGAFTGENSAATLFNMGAKFCLVGHSERRQLFNETDQIIAKKINTIQKYGLTPIFCIGETLDKRESGQTNQILELQMAIGLSEIEPGAPLWLAYEPVWAIGTGKVATSEQVRETHLFIREWLQKNQSSLAKSPLLYGGSVKPDNAAELGRQPNVDGFLIGGASLDVPNFLGIYRNAKK